MTSDDGFFGHRRVTLKPTGHAPCAPNEAGEIVKLRTKKEGGRLLDGREWNEFP